MLSNLFQYRSKPFISLQIFSLAQDNSMDLSFLIFEDLGSGLIIMSQVTVTTITHHNKRYYISSYIGYIYHIEECRRF